MPFIYRGWIPTVTGRLSFSHFGQCELYPTIAHLNRADGGKRFLVASQTRDTWDVLLPLRRWFGESIFGLRGRFYFIFVAETNDSASDEQSTLDGRVFLITELGRWQSIVRPALNKKCRQISDCFNQATSVLARRAVAQHIDEITSICEINSAFHAAFSLKRNGIIDLKIDADMRVAVDAPAFPTDRQEASHLRHILAAQLFSFIRDIGHRHKHHSPKTDTIVDLYDVDEGTEFDDITWRKRTLYSIYRRIITYKRQEDIKVQISSTGLLAYAKAFKKIWLEDFNENEKAAKIPAFYDDALKESIQASDGAMRFKLQARQERGATFRTVVVAVLGTTISASGLIKLTAAKFDATPSATLLWLAKFVVENFPTTVLYAVIGGWVWLSIRAGYLYPETSSGLKYIQMASAPLPKLISVALYFVVGIIFVGLALYLIA